MIHYFSARIIRVTLAILCVLPCATSTAAAGSPQFKLGVEQDGVYRVRFEDLDAGQWRPDSQSLALTNQGTPIPLWVEDGGDGLFGPGDHIEFIGRHLPGVRSYRNEHTRYNVYRLLVSAQHAKRLVEVSPKPGVKPHPPAHRVRHLEKDKLRVRFGRSRNASSPEIWYMARLSHLDPEPFALEMDLGQTVSDIAPVSFRIGLRGWSKPGRGDVNELPDHRVQIVLNGEDVGHGEWNRQDEHVIDVSVPASVLRPGMNRLELGVPKRIPAQGSDPLIDVVLLNWIQMSHPFDGALENGQVNVLSQSSGTPLRLRKGKGLIFNEAHERVRISSGDVPVSLESGESFLVAENAFLTPSWIVADAKSSLLDAEVEAEYLIISHRTLMEAVKPLAAFHRARGLTVSLVDVDDLYDTYNHGIESPEAIRAFVHDAYHRKKDRKPRFVLLVGDASWDAINDEVDDRYYADWTYKWRESSYFRKNGSTPYDDQIAQRNLVPTWAVETHEGLAASDNRFVAVAGDDWRPDLAIGRLPVARPEEVTAIVDKILAYARLAEIGPWRRNVLWITNDQKRYQRVSDDLADGMRGKGFASSKIYPSPEEKDNATHQASLINAFNDGQVLVHFIGHGGRYIWRTGPPDYHKNHDLFTLDDVERLAPNTRLPLVLSMTCYSAPFDHPTADSIGEKFLRLPNRGAIAVLAASWRNNPNKKFSRYLIEDLTTPGTRLGEAIMRTKQRFGNRVMVETYNLLGDPALELAIPKRRLMLEATSLDKGLKVMGILENTDLEAGRIIVDWFDKDGKLLLVQEKPVQSPRFSIEYPMQEAGILPASVRVYLWDAKKRIDAVGNLRLVSAGRLSAAFENTRTQ